MRLILGYRPSSGVHDTILESSTTRRLDSLMPDWRDWFETRNMFSSSLPDAPNDDAEAILLDSWIAEHEVGVIVALGQRVAMGLTPEIAASGWLTWHALRIPPRKIVFMLKLPHPSGRNRWYNDPTNCLAASKALGIAAQVMPPTPITVRDPDMEETWTS